MTRLPFIVTHDGQSARCQLLVNAHQQVKLIEIVLENAGSLAERFPCRDVQETNRAFQYISFREALRDKVELINDLLHAEMPFDALATCRRSPGLFGAILDPAATELENLRAVLNGGTHAAGA